MFPVDAFQSTLLKIVEIFKQHEIPFHLTGGNTTVTYGEPRMTQGIDLVVSNSALAECCDAFVNTLRESDFLFEAASIRRALKVEGMFQLLDTVESLKLDVYARELIPDELQRSILVEVFEGITLPVASRADAAASKLVWIHKGSQKSRRDLRQIFHSGDEADRALIRRLAVELQLEHLLDSVLCASDEVIE